MSYHFPSNSTYRNDGRVKMPWPNDPCYLTVEDSDGMVRSVQQEADHWLIGDAEGRIFSANPESFPTADEAIRSLIGDPQ